ncbi:hypothetical protein GCWU000282_02345 [Catonella morbi ATCC 51271]|uniref:Uncharacterized protein n=1 Tax=Catonella morbi ATCC 51271 TaxID=592026 RepID=V2Y3D8_9FIRM|nr:hypothetical protein GCWU000282_02345 [Catonella morbi ATCC 51271]
MFLPLFILISESYTLIPAMSICVGKEIYSLIKAVFYILRD